MRTPRIARGVLSLYAAIYAEHKNETLRGWHREVPKVSTGWGLFVLVLLVAGLPALRMVHLAKRFLASPRELGWYRNDVSDFRGSALPLRSV